MKFQPLPGGFKNRHPRAAPRRGKNNAKPSRAHTDADGFSLGTNSNARYRSGENVRMMAVKDFIVISTYSTRHLTCKSKINIIMPDTVDRDFSPVKKYSGDSSRTIRDAAMQSRP